MPLLEIPDLSPEIGDLAFTKHLGLLYLPVLPWRYTASLQFILLLRFIFKLGWVDFLTADLPVLFHSLSHSFLHGLVLAVKPEYAFLQHLLEQLLPVRGRGGSGELVRVCFLG